MVVEYDGTNYFGFQRQKNHISIQEQIENSLKFLCKHDVVIHAAGRTDTGVHASHQVIHADLNIKYDESKLMEALNFFLKDKDICIKQCSTVDNNFHARFSAKSRKYEYIILNAKYQSMLNKNVWQISKDLNFEEMQKAANIFIGTHDFSSFRDLKCQSKSPIKTIEVFELIKDGDFIKAYIKAKSFLHHQVRIMMGTLKLVGDGTIAASEINNIFLKKNRIYAGATAPSKGLTLIDVEY